MTDKNNELTIKFTGERKVFFTSKKPATDNTTSPAINAPILTPPPMSAPSVIPTITTAPQQPAQQPVPPPQPKQVTSPTSQTSQHTQPTQPTQSSQPNRPFARFTNSNINTVVQAPVAVQQPVVTPPPQVPVAKREKLPDEVAMTFDITKYKVVNPTVKF